MPLLRFPATALTRLRISSRRLFDLPAEHVIAQGRIVLCAVALLITGFEFTGNRPQAYAVLAFYSAMAIGIRLARVWRYPGEVAGTVIHAIDILALILLKTLNHWQPDPFFALFTLAILMASGLRWNWQAVAVTAAILGLVNIDWAAMAAGLDWNRPAAAFRGGFYSVTVGAMLAYWTALRDHRLEQMARLADLPGPNLAQVKSPSLANLIAHCASVLAVPRVLVLWEESEEPFTNIVLWDKGHYTHTRESSGAFGPFLKSEANANLAFCTADSTSQFVLGRRSMRLKEPAIDRALIQMFDIRSVGTAPVTGTLCKGRVFMLDRYSWSEFEIQLVQILASRIGNALDREIMQLQAKEAVATRERTTLLRDLHDSTLQSLTAVALQLKLISDGNEDDVPSRIALIEDVIRSEQRKIRDFMNQGSSSAHPVPDVLLKATVKQALSEAERSWNCVGTFSVDPEWATISGVLGAQLSLLLAEAAANAVRHGQASTLAVFARKTRNNLEIRIQDNGRGFDRSMTRSGAHDLTIPGFGPVSLRERVRGLGGSIQLVTLTSGTTLEIRLPVT